METHWTRNSPDLLLMQLQKSPSRRIDDYIQNRLLQHDKHKKLKDCVADLNKLLRNEPALYQNQFNIYGFEWVDLDHREESVAVYRRKGKEKDDDLLVILNMTPIVRQDWEIYIRGKSYEKEIFNSDKAIYWGTGNVYNPDIRCELIDKEQEIFRIRINLPPLAGLVLK